MCLLFLALNYVTRYNAGMEKPIEEIEIDIRVWLNTWSKAADGSQNQFFCSADTARAIADHIESCRHKHSRKGKAGRKPLGNAPLTNAERSKRKRDKKRAQPAPQVVMPDGCLPRPDAPDAQDQEEAE